MASLSSRSCSSIARTASLDLGTVCEELSTVKYKWREIGLQLCIPYHKLNEFEKEEGPYEASLYYWLRGNVEGGLVSWGSLVKALKSNLVSEIGLAKRIMKKYQVNDEEKGNEENSVFQESVSSTTSSGSFAVPILDLETYFPYLVEDATLSREELISLQLKLDEQTIKVKRAFASVVYKLQQNIEKTKRIDDLTNLLPFFDEKFRIITEDCTAISEVFSKINPHFSFFDFELIKLLTRNLGSRSNQQKLKEYKKMFKQFATQRVCECPKDAFGAVEDPNKVYIMKVDKSMEKLTLAELDKLKFKICEVLKIKFQLLQVKDGCVQLYVKAFQLEVMLEFSKKQQLALKELHVLYIQYGNKRLDISHSTKPVEVTAHQSDSGFSEMTTSKVHDFDDPRDEMLFSAKSKPARLPFLSPLYIAINLGKLGEVKAAVANGENPLAKDINSDTCLHYATRLGQFDILKHLIEEVECPPGITGWLGATILHIASLTKQLLMVQYLVEAEKCKLDPTTEDDFGYSVLHYACVGGDVNIVGYLIKSMTQEYMQLEDILYDRYISYSAPCPPIADGCLYNGEDFYKGPLCCACFCGHLSLVKILIEKYDCDVNHREGRIKVLPIESAIYGNRLPIVKYISSRKNFILSHRCEDEPSLVHMAVESGNVAMVEYLIQTLHCDYKSKWEDQTPLHRAALFGKVDILKYFLVTLKCDPTVKGYNGCLLIHYATLRGQLEAIKYLLSEKFSFATDADDEKRTALHVASDLGLLHVVKYLTLTHSCDPLAYCEDEFGSSFHIAAFKGHIEIAQFFVETLKCDPNVVNKAGHTPLHIAVGAGHLKFVKIAVSELGCDMTILTQGLLQYSVLHIATVNDHPLLVKYFLEEENLGNTSTAKLSLHLAAAHGCLDILQYLIEKAKLDKDTIGINGYSPLSLAAKVGWIPIVTYLLEIGSKPYDANFKTPLHYAALHGHLELVKHLVNLKFKMNIGCNPWNSPLHSAVIGDHQNIIKYFIEETKCDRYVMNHRGDTLLFIASKNEGHTVVEYLTQHNNSSIASLSSLAPLHVAVEGDAYHVEVLKHFIAHLNYDPNAPLCSANKPIHVAAWLGHLAVVKYFVEELDCDVDSCGFQNLVPLHHAALGGNVDTIFS